MVDAQANRCPPPAHAKQAPPQARFRPSQTEYGPQEHYNDSALTPNGEQTSHSGPEDTHASRPYRRAAPESFCRYRLRQHQGRKPEHLCFRHLLPELPLPLFSRSAVIG